MSIITSGSFPLPMPTFIAIALTPRSIARYAHQLAVARIGGSVMKEIFETPASWQAYTTRPTPS
jgi:hypothetical protein